MDSPEFDSRLLVSNQLPIQQVLGALSLGLQSLKLSTSLHLVPGFIMSGAKPSLPLCAFMKWTGTVFKVKINTNSTQDDEKDDCDETNLGIWYSGFGFSWLSRDTLGLDLNNFLSFQFTFTNHHTVRLIKQH
jgi:hypothetical protein